MVSEIKGSNHALLSGLANQHQADQVKDQAKAAGNKTQGTAEDSVSLTDQAEKIQALESIVASQPVVDTKRVEAIRSAILDGSYTIDSNKTADKMADFERLLDSKVGDS
ncbi:MAG TPA: flagellar biosynthesis anti-sigma factor FlgM [Thiotrichaceae bacterium]|jgi:negative regulator of flagellin synthesis FlgM|nr:flagellar biosynthesis anti-sigma factor FlgM [Thiotrichaceae bacterium]HIM08219.1 flagellar biosynthesis anti-sigma factor FlgM [Gammaproteobacteria bacterium]